MSIDYQNGSREKLEAELAQIQPDPQRTAAFHNGVTAAREADATQPAAAPEGTAHPFDSDVDGWDEPVPLDHVKTSATEAPRPTQSYPAALWEMVDATADAIQVPREMPLLMGVAVLSVAIGGRAVVEVDPTWHEPLCLYCAVALPSGERKSPTVKALTKGLRSAERELAEARQMDRELKELHREGLQKKLDTARKAIVDAESSEDVQSAEAEIPKLLQQLAELGSKEHKPQFTVDDTTVEALARVMSEQGSRMGLLSTEGGVFGMMAGRWGKPASMDLYLKAWSADPFQSDRQGEKQIQMDTPKLSMGVTLQPGLLQEIGQNRAMRDNGLLARWLYAIPGSLVGERQIDTSPIPKDVLWRWDSAVHNLVFHLWQSPEDRMMRLSNEASALLRGFRADHEPRMHPREGDLAPVADWANKFPGQLVRLAAVFTLVEDATAEEVTPDAMRTALDMAPFLEDHARLAFSALSGNEEAMRPAHDLLAWLHKRAESEPLETVKVRTAFQALKRMRWVSEGGTKAVRSAFEVLAEYGWVRPVEPAQGGKHKTVSVYRVNPRVSAPQGATP